LPVFLLAITQRWVVGQFEIKEPGRHAPAPCEKLKLAHHPKILIPTNSFAV
jgi:hypothetical protein